MRKPSRILWFDDQCPDHRRDAGSVRNRCLWRIFQEMGWDLTVCVFDPTPPPDPFPEVARLHTGVLAEDVSDLIPSEEMPDVIVLSRPDPAERYLSTVRSLWPDRPVIFDTHDLHHVREFRLARLLKSAPMLKNSLLRKRQEQSLMKAVDQVWTVSDAEAAQVRILAPDTPVSTVAWSYDVEESVPGFHDREGLFFVGSFFQGASPNAWGLRWFLEDVLPIVQEQLPGVSLDIVGGGVPDWLEAWNAPQVQVHGRVEDLSPFYHRARLAIVPLNAGAGIKGKILESWGRGLPVVCTPIAAEGFPEGAAAALGVAEDPASFAQAIHTLYHEPDAWQARQSAGRAMVKSFYSRESVTRQVKRVLEGLYVNRI